jgi:hypothetical protein
MLSAMTNALHKIIVGNIESNEMIEISVLSGSPFILNEARFKSPDGLLSNSMRDFLTSFYREIEDCFAGIGLLNLV